MIEIERFFQQNQSTSSSSSTSTSSSSTSYRPCLIGVQVDDSHLRRFNAFIKDFFKDLSFVCNVGEFVSIMSMNSTSSTVTYIEKLLKHEFIGRYICRVYVIDSFKNSRFLADVGNNDATVIRICHYPMSKTEKFATTLLEAYPQLQFSPTHFTKVLTCIPLSTEPFSLDSPCLFGLAPREWHFENISDCEQLPDNAVPISRAYYKIREVVLRKLVTLKSTDIVVDVGASPGGWSQFLSHFVSKVFAIDPAELKLDPMPSNVIPMKCLVQNAVVDLDMLDGIVCDMILKCDECLRIMKPLIAKLKSGGFLVLTLKLFATTDSHVNRVIERVMALVLAEFSELHNLTFLWLFANTERERTMIAFKK